MRAGQCSTTPWEVDFRDELVKRVRRKIEAEAFQEVRPLQLQQSCFSWLLATGQLWFFRPRCVLAVPRKTGLCGFAGHGCSHKALTLRREISV